MKKSRLLIALAGLTLVASAADTALEERILP